MVSLDLVWNVLGLDEGGPKEYEGIGRARDVRGVLAFIFRVGTGWAE